MMVYAALILGTCIIIASLIISYNINRVADDIDEDLCAIEERMRKNEGISD